MTVPVPYSLPTPSGWQLTDWRTLRPAAATAVGGVATITLGAVDPAERWLIDHMVISCSSSTSTLMRLYENQAQPASLLDGSATGNFDVADWPNGLRIDPSVALVAQWTGCSAGAIASFTAQIRVLRQVSS